MKAALSRREAWTAALVLAGAAFLLFANTFGHGWTYDDIPVIVENPDVRSWAGFLQDSYPGRPLRELAFLLDHALFGMDPAGWRVQNILWHGANALLLYLFVRRLGGGKADAALASALFLVHPVQVEVVANISHRKDSLALAFLLLSAHAYLTALASARRLPWLAAAAAAWGAALTAKQNALVLPLVLLALEWCFVPAERRLLLRRWMAAAVPVGMLTAVAWIFSRGDGASFSEMSQALLLKNQMSGGIGDYYRTVLAALAFQAGNLLWPAALAVEYLVPVPSAWTSPRILLPAAALALFGPALFFLRRRAPLAAFGLAWLGLFWLPVSNLWPSAYWAADRYLYVPLAGLCLLAASAVERLNPRLRNPVFLGAAVLLIALAVLAWRQSETWASEETLWQRALAVTPRSAFVMNELGKLREGEGKGAEAADFYRRAVAAEPRSAAAHYNLARIYEGAGLLPPAAEHYRAFLLLDRPAYRAQGAELRERLRRQYGWSLP